MKKLLVMVLASIILIPGLVSAEKSDLVKVYIFEAGGCPFCEAEVEYLKGLDSYNKKFTIVRKELYVDHIDWEQGKDYKIGVKVADAFKSAGFTDAAYNATPFVVISDLYAAASYSEDLESVINKAYDAGDKDVVGCYESGKSDCGLDIKETESTTQSEEKKSTDVTFAFLLILCLVVYLIKSTYDKNQIISLLKK